MAKWRKDGFEFIVHSDDHPPPHVHIWKAGTVMKVFITTLEIDRVHGMSIKDARNAMKICEEEKKELRKLWNKVHGNRKTK